MNGLCIIYNILYRGSFFYFDEISFESFCVKASLAAFHEHDSPSIPADSLPVIRALNETSANLAMSSEVLFKYKSNNDGWCSSIERYLNTLVGIVPKKNVFYFMHRQR